MTACYIREDVEMEQHIKTATAEIINNRIKTIRDRRDILLARSDYYLSMPDIKITDEKKDEILKYRQELRDFVIITIGSQGDSF